VNLNPLPPPREPIGLGRLPVARWFLITALVSGLAFLIAAGVLIMMIEEALALRPRAEVEAQLHLAVYALIALLGVVVLAAIGIGLVVRHAVLEPISKLAGQVRAVAAGDFDRRLQVDRPAELAELSSHVDSMRGRIVAAWRTAEEQSRELRRSNADLEQFAYVASHDLQEPLRKVASFSQMLEQRYADQLDDRAKQYIGFSVDGAKRMQSLINDLLDFSRVGRTGGERRPVETAVALRSALDNLAGPIEESGAEVTSDELPQVYGNAVLLLQLFQNLVANAVKFHGAEPPKVHLGVRQDGDRWEFSCSDNGIGVEPKYADRIFMIFQRLHPRDVYPGTGIGSRSARRSWSTTAARSGSHRPRAEAPHSAGRFPP
jgi:signal transduction histidine kinase